MQGFTIAFTGGGNMAQALIGGLIMEGLNPKQIWVSDPSLEKLQRIHLQFGVSITTDNREAVQHADTVVLAVKPQAVQTLATEIQSIIQDSKALVISIAAGIPLHALQQWLGASCAIVRCMPNTPALIKCGATGLFANPQVSAAQCDKAETILRAVGITVWVKVEKDLDIITALSGSGPAYFFLIMEWLEQAATRLGLDAEIAHLLTVQTALGAAQLAKSSAEPLSVLRERVTSKGGTTEQALLVMEQGEMGILLEQAVQAAHRRSQLLAKQLGQQRDH